MAIHKAFNGLTGCRVAGAAVKGFELEPVENWRVVAGRNHHAAHRVLPLDGKRNGGRRRWLRHEHNLKIITSQNLRGGARESVRKKSAVEADDDFQVASKDFGLRTPDFGLPIIRRGLRHARDIDERE